jgi:GalNAc-alpha-(1->4)-GalNAc-alpha-(1->3)-diNAcBac-PP-undecaprenol alpha-1,4-N-acetyl-D-galactosaminyltransferase
MSGMKKICLVIHSLGIGGMERVMAQLAAQFTERENTEVHLLLIGINREIVYQIPGSVKIHRPDFVFDNAKRTVNTFKTIRFVRKTVRKIDPDTVLSFGELWNNLVLLSLYGLKVPVYISDRSRPNKDLGKLHNILRNWLYPAAAGYIAQTKEAEAVCKQNDWNNNIKVIGNPIRKVKNIPGVEKENIVLTVGRLIPTKHIDRMIQLFAKINNPEWKLVIVGGDALRLSLSKELKKLISELNLEDTVILEGEQKEVDTYYNRSKVFAFTSSSEGFPNVIGEALSAGLPVVAYDCVAGPADMITNGENGFLIEEFDDETFREKLELLMFDKKLRKNMSLNSKKIISNYNVEEIANQFYNFILSGIGLNSNNALSRE